MGLAINELLLQSFQMPETILALELSHATASVALQRKGELLYTCSWHADRDHSKLYSYLQETRGFDVVPDLILVGAGPGSYGGIRVGLAAADGLAFVDQSKIASICSWEALDSMWENREGSAYVIANARRNGWVTGCISDGRLTGELDIISSGDLPDWILEHSEEKIVSTENREILEKAGLGHAVAGATPKAEWLIQSWGQKTIEEQNVILDRVPAPIYVRPPHITPAKRPPWFISSQK